MLARWEAVDVPGTEVMLKLWEGEASVVSWCRNGTVRGSDCAKEVSIAVMPVK